MALGMIIVGSVVGFLAAAIGFFAFDMSLLIAFALYAGVGLAVTGALLVRANVSVRKKQAEISPEEPRTAS